MGFEERRFQVATLAPRQNAAAARTRILEARRRVSRKSVSPPGALVLDSRGLCLF